MLFLSSFQNPLFKLFNKKFKTTHSHPQSWYSYWSLLLGASCQFIVHKKLFPEQGYWVISPVFAKNLWYSILISLSWTIRYSDYYLGKKQGIRLPFALKTFLGTCSCLLGINEYQLEINEYQLWINEYQLGSMNINMGSMNINLGTMNINFG